MSTRGHVWESEGMGAKLASHLGTKSLKNGPDNLLQVDPCGEVEGIAGPRAHTFIGILSFFYLMRSWGG
jgi:hypothetical protein